MSKGQNIAEQNIEMFQRLQFFLQFGEERTCDDFIEELMDGGFEGYEYVFFLIMVMSNEPAVRRAWRRLYLELCQKELETQGSRAVMNHILFLLLEEKEKQERPQEPFKAKQSQTDYGIQH